MQTGCKTSAPSSMDCGKVGSIAFRLHQDIVLYVNESLWPEDLSCSSQWRRTSCLLPFSLVLNVQPLLFPISLDQMQQPALVSKISMLQGVRDRSTD